MFEVQQARAAIWKFGAEGLGIARVMPNPSQVGFTELVGCPSRNLVYVHVYKAAGSSIDQALCEACRDATCHVGCGPETLHACQCGYQNCQFAQMFTLDRTSLYSNPAIDDHMNLFTVLRWPVSRFVSVIAQLKFMNKVEASATCSDVLDEVEAHRTRTGNPFFDMHLKPQASFMFDQQRHPLPFKYIFYVDEMEDVVVALLGLHKPMMREHSSSWVDEKADCAHELTRIRELYDVDFRLFKLLRGQSPSAPPVDIFALPSTPPPSGRPEYPSTSFSSWLKSRPSPAPDAPNLSPRSPHCPHPTVLDLPPSHKGKPNADPDRTTSSKVSATGLFLGLLVTLTGAFVLSLCCAQGNRKTMQLIDAEGHEKAEIDDMMHGTQPDFSRNSFMETVELEEKPVTMA